MFGWMITELSSFMRANPRNAGSRRVRLMLAAIFLLAAGEQHAKANEKLPARYRKWLDEDVVYLTSKEERESFLKLTTDEEREKFIERFWEIHNPLPGSPSSTYKEEHYRRLAYVNEHFGREAGIEGWRTDRGRAYITLGPPQQRSLYYGNRNLRPMEVWFYSSTIPALPPFFYLVFYQREDVGDYRFYSPYFDGPEKLITTLRAVNNRVKALGVVEDSVGREVARVTLSLIPDEPVDLQGATASLQSDVLLSAIRNLANHPLVKAEVERRTQLLENVTARLILEGQNLDVLTLPLRDSRGLTRCHYLLRLRRPQDLTVAQTSDGRYYYSIDARVHVFGSDNKLIFTQEKTVTHNFDQHGLKQIQDKVLGYEGWLPLPPGKYRLDFLLTDWLKKAGYHVEKEVVIPETASAGMLVPGALAFSDADMVDPAKADFLPFTVAGVKFTPLLGQQLSLSPGQAMSIVYQIWAAGRDPRAYQGQKLEVEYAFGRPATRGDAKVLRDVVGKEQFDLTGSLVNGKKISLEGLQPGNYLLTLKVLDLASQQTAYSTLSFRVLADATPGPAAWDIYDETIGEDVRKGVPDYDRGLCYLNLGRREEAERWFREAEEKNPSDELVRARLVDLYFGRQAYAEIAQLYSRSGITEQTREQTLLRVAESLDKLGETKKAAQMLESALKTHAPSGPILLTLSSYYQRLGDAGKAAEFARRSESLATVAPAKP